MRAEDTANILFKYVFGKKYQDEDLVKFVADRLEEGESPFEVIQFLKTTPDFLKKHPERKKRLKERERKARKALNLELKK